MDSRYVLNVWLLSTLMLTFFYEKSSSLKVADLSRTCLYYFPFEIENESYADVNPLEGFCKAVATYWDNSTAHPPRIGMDIIAFKRDLPYVYIYDRFSCNDMKYEILPDNIQAFIDNLNVIIQDRRIDVLVLDFFNDESDELEKYDKAFQDDLTTLCDKIKKNHKDMLLGLKLHRNAEVVKSALNVDKMKNIFDFYLIGYTTYGYKQCIYQDDRTLMATPPTTSEMKKSIDDLKKIGYDVKKMFLTILIYVISYKESGAKLEYWSNTWMCQADPGDDRRFCRGTLENIYEQSRVVYDNGLAGVFVEAIDCDDYRNTCGCSNWPATKCIRDGIEGRDKNDFLLSCKNFGHFPDENP